MTNHASGKAILEYAREYSLRNMREAVGRGVHNGVLRSAQEVFELALKAGVRELGGDYPKVHDPAAGFIAVAGAAGVALSPPEMRRLLEESKWLADNRGPALYLERTFTAEDAARAAAAAEWALELVEQRVFRPPA